jgi:hypothetical protein
MGDDERAIFDDYSVERAAGARRVLASAGKGALMRPVRVAAIVLTFVAGVSLGCAATVFGRQTTDTGCLSASAQLRTTLYFGLARPKGSVSELEWQVFLRDEVTARFPDGLTVWDADGQWRGPSGTIDHENSKVLLLVHPDTPVARGSVQAVIERYRKTFEQESVLWETARVCVAS